jgi:hypothetical protein
MSDFQEQEIVGLPNSKENIEPVSKAGIQSIQGENNKVENDWVDHGIIDVPVKDLPTPEGVSNTSDFNHHISWENAKSASEQLPDIQKEVNNGKSAEDFSKEDELAGLDNSHGKRKVYDLYYGNDPVAVEKIGDQYNIITGRHRIFAAQTLGLETIPARVMEKSASTK